MNIWKHTLIRMVLAFSPIILFTLWIIYIQFLPEDDPTHRSDAGLFFIMLLIFHAFGIGLALLVEALYFYIKRKYKLGNIDLGILIVLGVMIVIILFYA